MANVLIVDDEQCIRVTLGAFLEADGHAVQVAQYASEARSLLRRNRFDVVLADVVLPTADGLSLLDPSDEQLQHTQFIFITGDPQAKGIAECIKAGGFDYLTKPVTGKEACAAVRTALKTSALQTALRSSANRNARLIADSDHDVQQQVDLLRAEWRSSDACIRRLNLIQRLASGLRCPDENQLLYRAIGEHACQLMDTSMFILSAYSKPAAMIHALYVLNDGDEMDAQKLPPIPLAHEGKGRQSQVIRSGQPLVMGLSSERPPQTETEYTITAEGEVLPGKAEQGGDVIRSALFVPILHGGTVRGVVQVQSYRENAYSAADLSALAGMASLTSRAVAQHVL